MGLTLRLGTPLCTQQEYNTCLELVPPSFRFYVEAIYERRQAIVPDFEALHQQRRLYAESRLAAAAAAAANSNESGVRPNSQGVGAPGVGGTEDPNEEACNEVRLVILSVPSPVLWMQIYW
ncbi:unnamed protein product [Protopolystoma xenopodis]|uniref:Uncharacterized protein n=1 Tax=Protopolystoma xenopodis TaxID=117903 RepID=A0A448X3L3_9PLAT|nr:unnamed protein product [Protopolystoma xenopodis]